MNNQPNTRTLKNGNLCHVCPYKINKGARSGQMCGITIRDSDYLYCCMHRRSLQRRRDAVNRLTAKEIAV